MALNLNGDRLIRLPVEDSKANYLAGFWRWVELMAADDYHGALESLHWPKGTAFTPAKSFGILARLQPPKQGLATTA